MNKNISVPIAIQFAPWSNRVAARDHDFYRWCFDNHYYMTKTPCPEMLSKAFPVLTSLQVVKYVGSILVVVPTSLNFRRYFMADLIWTSFIGAYQIEPSWPDSRMNKIEKLIFRQRCGCAHVEIAKSRRMRCLDRRLLENKSGRLSGVYISL